MECYPQIIRNCYQPSCQYERVERFHLFIIVQVKSSSR